MGAGIFWGAGNFLDFFWVGEFFGGGRYLFVRTKLSALISDNENEIFTLSLEYWLILDQGNVNLGFEERVLCE